jgi:hypothetical protein
MPLILPTADVAAGELLQHASRVAYRGKQLYFGCDGTNRYDDPDKTYGVLYLAADIPTALMESVFHKHRWRTARRTIARTEISKRMIRAVGVFKDLRLADLSAPGVMASQFGLNLGQLASRNYRHTQKISADVHAHVAPNGDIFDGVLYPSRNNYPAVCIALFDRAKAKVDVIKDIDMPDHAEWPAFKNDYKIIVLPR